MKLFLVTISAMLSVSLLACSKHNAGPDTNPSIKADYQDKVSFLNASLSTSADTIQTQSTNLSNDEYNLLYAKISELRSLNPAHGFSVSQTLDSLSTIPSSWKFESVSGNALGPALRVDSIQEWSMIYSTSGSHNDEFYVSLGSYSEELKPSGNPVYYVDMTAPSFDYDHNAPNFSTSPGAVVTLPANISLDSPGTMNRTLLKYSIYSAQTISAIQGFQAVLDGVSKDLSAMQNQTVGNYPVKYTLQQDAAKIEAAFNNLP